MRGPCTRRGDDAAPATGDSAQGAVFKQAAMTRGPPAGAPRTLPFAKGANGDGGAAGHQKLRDPLYAGKLDAWLTKLNAADLVALDTETTSLTR